MSSETDPTPSGHLEPWRILDNLYDRALMRFLEHSGFDYRDYLDDDEIAEYAAAEAAEQAQIGFSTLETTLETRHTTKGNVVIEVLGGVAEVTSQPDDIEVEIIDHDNVKEQGLE